MSTKILVGLLAIFGLLGLGFAWGGFMASPAATALPDDVKEQFKTAFEEKDFEALKELRAEYLPAGQGPLAGLDNETRENILSLRGQIHDAMSSGDYDTANELHQQMKDLLPEGFRPMGSRMGMRGFGHFRDAPEGCPFAQ